jgi:hypothetical protein
VQPATEHATRLTFRNEVWRSMPSGVLETLSGTFGMLIAVRVFHMDDLAKSIFLSSTSGGLMTSLFVVPLLLRARATLAATAARVQFVGGAFLALAALFPASPWLFILGSSFGLFCFSMQIPLLTQIYRLNYPEAARGRLFALAGVLRAATAVGFGFLGGWLIGRDLDHYRGLLWGFAACAFVSGWLTQRLPSVEWSARADAPPGLWAALHWVKIDRDFRTLLISWMMMGVGNLIAACLFVEYLANPRHGINLPERDVAWITGVVPVAFRMICAYPWGVIYDRVGLFKVRAILNLIFAAGILCFYLGQGWLGWTVGMALWGVANAGGNVTWGLWVTKLAPAHAVAEYMSVHSFFTGLRGLVAPYLAFAALGLMSFQTLAILCSIGIVAASAFITVRSPEGAEREGERL